MSERVFLHVGTPKTGTSYLQDVLFRNQPVLREAGFSYHADRHDAHFLAALDLMQLPWGGLQHEAVGAWDALAAAVRETPGTAVVSHEILATASRAQVDRALASVGHRTGGGGTEVHVLLSVRDLVRQIPAEWQENVKHRSRIRYAAFLDQIEDPARATRIGSWFWGVQAVPEILDRWAGDLPPERVHLVTVPPPGGAPDLLWRRFTRALGLEDLDLDLSEVDRANPSLGVPETALIRRLNRRANALLPPADYRPLVRELLAHQTLSRRTGSPRLTLPPRLHAWARELSATYAEEVAARGYDVVGDLDDLLGAPLPDAPDAPDVPDGAGVTSYADPDRPRERQVSSAALDAVTVLLQETARLRHAEESLRRDLDETRAALDRAYDRPVQRAKERVVGRLEHSGPGRAALGVYRLARGRSSRSA